jgi:hypothetical protein
MPTAATCLIGVSPGLPLFSYLRERQLSGPEPRLWAAVEQQRGEGEASRHERRDWTGHTLKLFLLCRVHLRSWTIVQP